MLNNVVIGLAAAAEITGFSVTRVWELVSDGEIPGEFRGRVWIFDRRELRRFRKPMRVGRPKKV